MPHVNDIAWAYVAWHLLVLLPDFHRVAFTETQIEALYRNSSTKL